MYRDKQFKTARFLYINNRGVIIDHLAVTNHLADRVNIIPDPFEQDEFFNLLATHVRNAGSRMIFVHNHPLDKTGRSRYTLALDELTVCTVGL
jgi:hypothetical protein